VVHGQVEKEVDRDRSTANDMEKTMNESLEPTEKGENPKERLGRLKPDLSLIPQTALILESLAMMQGDDKYGAYNWRKTKVQARTYIAAAMRHLAAWLDGEEDAPDSGIHHLAHARASLGVVMDAQVCGMMVDDRVKGEAGRILEENVRTIPKEGDISAKVLVGGASDALLEIALGGPGPKPTDKGWRDEHVPVKIPGDDGPINPLIKAALEAAFVQHETGLGPDIPPPTFYLSGPMRGIEDFNFPAFDKARDLGRSLGYTIISPADMDREVGVDENTDEATVDVRTFAKRDTEALIGLDPRKRDGIAMLPGWEGSIGGLAELMLARWLGIRVVSALTFQEFRRGSPANTIAKMTAATYWEKGGAR